ncbi:hypothetical protein BDR06DRAFT_1005117 [Suillus hirtellus]|nr:hypothetical protein BDR06DRAFT_1005117 [Suillus hirtellus]
MPSLAEDSDDFTAALDAVEDTDSESNDEQDSESESDAGSDLGTLRTILNVPQPDTPMHEVCKALEVTQHAYTAETSTVNSSISRAGKMYAMFNYFWVMNGLFPTTPQPNVDPRSNTRWSSPDAKLKGAMAELYLCMPKTLHKAMETYTQFRLLFCAAVSSERSNILHVIKDCAGSIFSNLKLDPTTFTDEPSKKKENTQLLILIKKNGEGEYTRLVPILFKDPSAIIPNDFLMLPILIKIIHVKMFGKAVLSGKTKGHPKARGQCWAMQCITEGMIAGAAILACFLLLHDHELTAIGPATKIKYQQDFNFYLEQLFKCSSWAISVMDYYNREVFGMSLEPSASATVPSISHSHSWEDDFLQQLDSETPTHPPPPAPTPTLSVPVATPISSQLTYVSAPVTGSHTDVVSNYHFTATTISQGGVASASAIIDTQLQVDIGQLSLKDSAEPSASKSRRAPAATTHKRHTGATQKAQSAVDSDMSPIVPLAPPPAVKRVTHNSSNRVKKAVGKTK